MSLRPHTNVDAAKTHRLQAVLAAGRECSTSKYFENFLPTEALTGTDHGEYIYDGEAGTEVLVRREFKDGVTEYYEGQPYEEYMVRKTFEGHVSFYEGSKGNEHRVRHRFPNGDMGFYEGEKGSEYTGVVEEVCRLKKSGGGYSFERKT